MVTVSGSVGNTTLAGGFPGRVPAAYAQQGAGFDNAEYPRVVDGVAASPKGSKVSAAPAAPAITPTVVSGATGFSSSSGFDWFERFHILDRSYDFGNVITAVTKPLYLYNAHRRQTSTLTTVTNNAGVGTTVGSLPTLPGTIHNQAQLDLSIDIATNGQSNVNSTIVFDFGTGDSIPVPIILSRLVFFSIPPEMPYRERLEFKTNILEKRDGTEQRVPLRKNPRQVFQFQFKMDEGKEQGIIDSFLFDWQARLFGVAVWDQLTPLTAAVSIGASSLPVQDTDFADFKIGDLAVIFQSQTSFEIVEVSSLTTTSIGLLTTTQQAFNVGDAAIPIRIARLNPNVRGSRFTVGMAIREIDFTVLDNDNNIGSTAAFSTFNSKVLLDDSNVMPGRSMGEGFIRQITTIDNETGKVTQGSSWDKGKRVSQKTFLASGRQSVWEHRQLIHSLKGRLTSFYLPTFWADLVPTLGLTSGSFTLDIQNIGYVRFVAQRQPKNIIRVTFKDGTTPIIRTITSSVVVDSSTERLTLDTTWPTSETLSNIDKVMYVEESRFNSDTITLIHDVGSRSVKFTAPVKTVFE